MVLPFRRAVVNCCTGRVLTLDVAMVVMLGRSGWGEYVKAEVSAGDGRVVWGARGCSSVGFSVVCCLEVCMSGAAVVTSGSEISGKRVVVVCGVYVRLVLATTILRTSLVRSAT